MIRWKSIRVKGEALKTWLDGGRALYVQAPLSGLARSWRRLTRRLRGKKARGLQPITLPRVSWRNLTRRRMVPLRETNKANGNVRSSELAILSLLAADCRADSLVFEIGTFDGRTTLNLAFSVPDGCRVLTLDLPADVESALPLDAGERHMVDKPVSGARIDRYRGTHPEVTDRIEQHLGDSARFDFSPWYGCCDLVFVDASHAAPYVLSDSRQAVKLLRPGGMLVWHDYGIWEGVTQALEELDREEIPGIRAIAGTSLACWRKPD